MGGGPGWRSGRGGEGVRPAHRVDVEQLPQQLRPLDYDEHVTSEQRLLRLFARQALRLLELEQHADRPSAPRRAQLLPQVALPRHREVLQPVELRPAVAPEPLARGREPRQRPRDAEDGVGHEALRRRRLHYERRVRVAQDHLRVRLPRVVEQELRRAVPRSPSSLPPGSPSPRRLSRAATASVVAPDPRPCSGRVRPHPRWPLPSPTTGLPPIALLPHAPTLRHPAVGPSRQISITRRVPLPATLLRHSPTPCL